METSFSSPDADENEYRIALIANNLISPESFSDSNVFSASNLNQYIARGASLFGDSIDMTSDGLEIISFLKENSHYGQ